MVFNIKIMQYTIAGDKKPVSFSIDIT
jgi:hypothetical protein